LELITSIIFRRSKPKHEMTQISAGTVVAERYVKGCAAYLDGPSQSAAVIGCRACENVRRAIARRCDFHCAVDSSKQTEQHALGIDFCSKLLPIMRVSFFSFSIVLFPNSLRDTG
ncbi:hypothetical protein RvY_06883, partial [Ramazzottius varieornatus]